MSSIYYYAAAFLLCGLAIQQIFYIKNRYSQQNIRIIEYYLYIRLVSKILSDLNNGLCSGQKNKIRELIKSYYYLDDVVTYKTSEGKFDLQSYEIESLALLTERIPVLYEFLIASKPCRLHKLDKTNHIYGIYFPYKKIIVFIIKQKKGQFSDTELNFLEHIILPLFIVKD